MDKLVKRKREVRIKRIFRHGMIHLVALCGCLATALPLIWMISTSLKQPFEISAVPPVWLPEKLNWQNYRDAVKLIPFVRYFLNTLYVTVVKMGGEIFISALVAYGFARFEFKGKNVLFMILMATIMVPGEATIIPSYILYSKLHLIDTYFPIAWSAYFGGNITFVFLLRMYFLSIPKELDESAYMDGAGSWTIFWRIIVPISVPALTTVAIMSFMGSWGELLGPLLYINSYEKNTLQVGLSMFRTLKEVNWGAQMAASFLALLPPLVLYFFGQKYIVEGIKSAGIKG